MIIYADTSALFALFHPGDQFAAEVTTRTRRHAPDFLYPAFLRFELRHVLTLWRKDAHGETAWRALNVAESHRLRGVREDWLGVLQSASDLSSRHGREHPCGAVDVLHVALALKLAAAEFWTCDGAQSGFARAAGLKVVQFSADETSA